MPESGELRSGVILPERVLENYFEDFKTKGDPIREQMRDEAMRFCRVMSSTDLPSHWLSLLGPSGTGKTMLAKIIVKFFHRRLELERDENRGRTGDNFLRNGGMLSWPKMIDRMMEGDFGFASQAQQDWLLVLDDVGASHPKLRELSASKLFSILNERQGKFTVITANLGVEEISEQLDPRIASRLLRHGGSVVDSTGCPDYSL